MSSSLSRRSLLAAGLAIGGETWLTGPRSISAQAASSDAGDSIIARIGDSTYASLALASAAAPQGGVIEILPGVHVGSRVAATIPKSVTIRGVRDSSNIRPTIDLGAATVVKSILNPKGDLILEDLIIRGARTPAGGGDNGAGLRPESSCLRMVVRRSDFINNQNGVLTPRVAPGAVYEFEDCLFDDNGKGDLGYTHNVYFGRADKVILTRCTFQHSFAGDEVKSRSLEMIIDRCYILNTRHGRAISYPNGGRLRVLNGTVVRKIARASFRELVSLCREATDSDNRPKEFLFENSTLDNQRSPGIVIHNDARSGVTAIVRNCRMPGRTTMLGLVHIS